MNSNNIRHYAWVGLALWCGTLLADSSAQSVSENQKIARAAMVLVASARQPVVDPEATGTVLSEDEEKKIVDHVVRLGRCLSYLESRKKTTQEEIARYRNYCDKPDTDGDAAYWRTRVENLTQESALLDAAIDQARLLHEQLSKHPATALMSQLQSQEDRVVRGDVFRVPNGIYKADDLSDIGIDSTLYEVGPDGNNASVQVWATTANYRDTLIIHLSEEEKNDSDGSCNWANHGHPRVYQFPSYLPLTLFIDEEGKLKKDGDMVVLYHNNPLSHERVKIVLTLNQRGYRYARCGNDWWDGKHHDGGFDNCIRASKNYEAVVEPFLSDAGRAEDGAS